MREKTRNWVKRIESHIKRERRTDGQREKTVREKEREKSRRENI